MLVLVALMDPLFKFSAGWLPLVKVTKLKQSYSRLKSNMYCLVETG